MSSPQFLGWVGVAIGMGMGMFGCDDKKEAAPPSDPWQDHNRLQAADVGQGKVEAKDIATLAPRSLAPALDPPRGSVATTFDQANQIRIELLKKAAQDDSWAVLPSAPPVDPEDLSARPARAAMSVKNLPGLESALVNTYQEIQIVGLMEGFTVQAGVPDKTTLDRFKKSVGNTPNALPFVEAPQNHNLFLEDLLSSSNKNVVNVLPKLPYGPGDSEKRESYDAWMRRDWATRHGGSTEGADTFNEQKGADGGRETAFSHAAQAGKQARVTYGYCEGGNQLSGTMQDGRKYAVVGKNCVGTTQYALKHELGIEIDSATAGLLISKDLGLPRAQVHFVEQPAMYHLDMAMVPAQRGVIWLNDSKAAAQHELAFVDNAVKHGAEAPPDEVLKRFASDAIARDQLESQTEQELKAAGLTVKRVPGLVYSVGSLSGYPIHSMLNGEMGTNGKGQGFFVTAGADQASEMNFLESIKDSSESLRVYFLDRRTSAQLSQLGSGVGCVIRTMEK